MLESVVLMAHNEKVPVRIDNRKLSPSSQRGKRSLM
jgi:hypothetical protein